MIKNVLDSCVQMYRTLKIPGIWWTLETYGIMDTKVVVSVFVDN